MDSPTTITPETWQQINYETLRKLHQQLTDAEISYVVIGEMALALHGYRRLTEDINLLMSRQD